LHIHGDQEDLGTQVGRRCCRLTTGMAGTYYYNVIFWKHICEIGFANKIARFRKQLTFALSGELPTAVHGKITMNSTKG
jgi:hypothetical protein